ncbi:MAG TPA: cation:proton antiporter [Leptolyngbyaceae cyanobacterium M65_K2018_010]|nr:cation:proton antiporter [Leptolyngbyaceae cyanobacterium M65_K2018_010]
MVFLLLGDQVLFPYFMEHIGTSLVAIVAAVLSRAVAIFGFSALSGWITGCPIPWAEQTVLGWVGLRGSVAIALALSIPDLVSDRQQIISNSFGVVLFTLLIQGLTTKPLLDRLNGLDNSQHHQQYLERLAQQQALKRVLQYLNNGEIAATIGSEPYQQELGWVKQQLHQLDQELASLKGKHPEIEAWILQQHQDQLLALEAATYTDWVQAGWLKTMPPLSLPGAFEEIRASLAPRPSPLDTDP